jgi:hypothetical protein
VTSIISGSLVEQRGETDCALAMDDRVGHELAGQQPGILQLRRVKLRGEPSSPRRRAISGACSEVGS